MFGLIFIIGWVLIIGFLMLLTPPDHDMYWDGPPPWVIGVLLGWTWPISLPLAILIFGLYFVSKKLGALGTPLRRKLGMKG